MIYFLAWFIQAVKMLSSFTHPQCFKHDFLSLVKLNNKRQPNHHSLILCGKHEKTNGD